MHSLFANTEKELTIIYFSGDHIGRQILAYAHTEGLPIHDIDLAHTTLTESHWAEIADRMGVDVKELVNTEDTDFLQKFRGVDNLSDKDWLTLIRKNPDILRAPVVMKGEKVVMMSNPQDMLYFVK